MSRRDLTRTAIAIAVLAAMGGGYVMAGEPGFTHAPAMTDGSPQQSSDAVAAIRPLAMSPVQDFSGIVQRYGPAVVNISVTGTAKPAALWQNGPQLGPNDPFFEFFRRFQPQMPSNPDSGPAMRGLGSGFIITSDGTVLTNAHVVDHAKTVRVKLTDGREFKARVIGVDDPSDVAVLKIDATNLPVVQIGDSDKIRVGEPVLAIGSPYGFDNSATSGIVSATSRSLSGDNYLPFIQTDAAVNPGNSGGPLFDVNGQVIGINAQIYTRTGGYQGLSFAVPIDGAMKVEQQLVAHGKVERGHLGITVQEVTQPLAESFGLKEPHGALVSSVDPGSPAQRAGLQPGDVIVRFADHDIRSSMELPAYVADQKPGTQASLEIIRHGSRKELSVALGALNGDVTAQAGNTGTEQGRLGLAVRPLQPDEQRQAGVTGGLLVEEATGPAAEAGIQSGDVILSMDGTPVSSVSQLRDLAGHAGKHLALLVQRDQAKIFVPIDLG